jgi:hypothetical protein
MWAWGKTKDALETNIVMKYTHSYYYNVYLWYNQMKTSGRKVDSQSMTSTTSGLSFGGCDLFAM